ncbi:uncharacterized protein UV8b_03323 [Ustilaginoidea virens]|uniref:Zn(2)-C6 fungal-type domain-containing protein n=1 Tax=Ustilaginoidea virens TaxID=1159556 RepID=A0A8E5MGN0_USTVR|nr:uncharacterized protein UV8b_03323 [Ustilaginoidea virens]QUC19082.1 hypothetical protein UV8b_03323 [Ustilaginoidea virens]
MAYAATTRQQPGLACEECRRRKARCDRVRPQCGICAEAGHKCVVVEKRSQRGPKKGQLKDLRSRVAVLERRLVSQAQAASEADVPPLGRNDVTPERDILDEPVCFSSAGTDIGVDALRMLEFSCNEQLSGTPEIPLIHDTCGIYKDPWNGCNGGLASPYPLLFTTNSMQPSPLNTHSPQAIGDGELDMSDLVQAELDLLYFERVHHFAPMIHKRRYLAWAGDEKPSPAKACLRLAMRTVSASMSAQLGSLSDVLYATTRRLLETLDARGESGSLPWITILDSQQEQVELERIQAWLLLAYYEILRKTEHQALLTAERAFRLLQLSGLFNVDARGIDSSTASTCSPSSSPSRAFSSAPSPAAASPEDSWIEVEEKRRTLWTAFVLDRLSTMLNNQPLRLHEEIIRTRLPMPEAEFQDGHQPACMNFLHQVMGNGDACATLPPFAECVVLTNLFSRCVAHRRLTQSVPLCASDSESRDFWARHGWLATTAASATTRQLRARGAPASDCWGSFSPKCDLTIWFNLLLGYSASVSLSETAETNPWLTLEDHLTVVSYRQIAYEAACEVAVLVKTAPRMAFLKVHPFLPNVISMVANFAITAMPSLLASEEEQHDHVQNLVEALRHLGAMNNLARESLFKLEAEITSGNLTADGS